MSFSQKRLNNIEENLIWIKEKLEPNQREITMQLLMCLRIQPPYSTIFEKTEDMLDGGDFLEALYHLTTRQSRDRYRSDMDFIVCGVFPKIRPLCFRYYRTHNEDLKLLNQLSKADIELVDEILSKFLGFCQDHYESKGRASKAFWKIKKLLAHRLKCDEDHQEYLRLREHPQINNLLA